MKYVTIIIAVLAGLLLISAPSVNASLFSSSEEKAKAYVNLVVPEIVSNWDMAALSRHAHPDFFKITSRDQVERYFFTFRMLGQLKESRGTEGELLTTKTSKGEKYTIGTYNVEADFENGSGTINVQILKAKTGWAITSFTVNSDTFISKNKVDEEKKNKPRLSVEEMKTKASFFLEENIEKIRSDVDQIFPIARYFSEQGNIDMAVQLYEKALTANSTNLDNQMQFAELLIADNKPTEAGERLFLIHDLAEDNELLKKTDNLLNDLKKDPRLPSPSASVDSRMQIMLVPVGTPSSLVMIELQTALQKKMGMEIIISESAIPLGDANRSCKDRYINQLYEKLSEDLSPMQKEMIISKLNLDQGALQAPLGMSRFLMKYFSLLGQEGIPVRVDFDKTLRHLGEEESYDAKRLTDAIRTRFPFDKSDKVKAYIGITEKDLIADEDCNFVYGETSGAYGVISYYGFTAKHNQEEQDRPRLVKRLLKQALSSTNFALGFARCNTPYCARAYPNSLGEHDAKSEDLCQECQLSLAEYKKDMRSETSAYEYCQLGNSYELQGELDKAVVSFLKGIELHDNYDGPANFALARVYMRQKQDKKAAEALRKYIDIMEDKVPEGELISVYLFLGEYYNQTRRFDEAALIYDKAVKLIPRNIEVLTGLGIAYEGRGKSEKALEFYKAAFDLAPEEFLPNASLGMFYSQQGKPEQSLEYFEKALQITPSVAWIHLNLGVSLYSLGESEKARKQLHKAVEIDPSLGEAYSLLGKIYGESGMTEEALSAFKTATELQPNSPIVWNDLGFTYYSKKEYRTAIANYQRALELAPEFGLCHYNKALAHYALKEFDMAVSHVDRAVVYGYKGSNKFKEALQPYRK